MLVLTRMLNEVIVIEPVGIEIKIVGVTSSGQVRIGINAPDKQTILRGELVGRYARYREEAAQVEQRRRDREQQD